MTDNFSSPERPIDLTSDYKHSSSNEAVEKNMHEKINSFLENEKVCMLTTSDLSSRPMHLQQHESGRHCLWFFGAKDSQLSQAIGENSLVNVSFAVQNDSQYLSMTGHASVGVDRQKIDELWNRLVEVWYPLGKADPNLCLIRIDLTAAEGWMGPKTKLEEFYRMGKSLLTGNNAMDDSIEHFKINYKN